MDTLFIGYSDGLVRCAVDGIAASQRVLSGAAVSQVVTDPHEPSRMYAATLGDGLWCSDDGGGSFRRLPGLERELVWSVAVSATDRRGGLGAVYAGTQMSALHRSLDGGATFEELTSVQEIPSRFEWSFPPEPDTHHVHQITLDNVDPGTIVFGVELGGVYHSADRGETWSATEADPDPHTLRTHPTAEHRMYEGGGASYCESRDGGSSWQRVVDGIPDRVRYFFSLAVDSGDPDNVILSAALDNATGHATPGTKPEDVWSTLYRLDGGVWQEVLDGTPPCQGTAMGHLAAGASGVFYYVTEPGDIYVSRDGGRSFEGVSYAGEAVRGRMARSACVVEG